MFWIKAIDFNTWSTAAAIHVQCAMISELYIIFKSNISRVICMHLICYDSSDKNCFTKQDVFYLLIISHFLVNFILDRAVLLKGMLKVWSLLGVKGLLTHELWSSKANKPLPSSLL